MQKGALVNSTTDTFKKI